MYLAIDLGTTGCRSIIFDGKTVVSDAYEEYGLITGKDGYVEQDAELWWQAVKRTTEKAMRFSDIKGEDILGVSISSQGITIVPVDKNAKPLCNALSWLDVRATEEIEQIKKDFGEKEMFSLTGKPLKESYTLPKLLWLQKNKKEIFEKAYKFLMPLDFLTAKLTGKFVTDRSMASGTLMYDIKKGVWSKDILDFYSIPEEKLPKIGTSGENIGLLCQEAQKELGLNKNCVVALGAQDQKCAAFGAGLDSKTITVSLGTAAAITKKWDECHSDENQSIPWSGYVEDGTFVTEAVLGTAGTCLRWVRDLFFKGEEYSVIDKEAEEAINGEHTLMFYPHLSNPTEYDKRQGFFYGANLNTTRGCFAAAVMEGVAFSLRSLLEDMNAYENADKIILFGGGAKGILWPQIISDITGLEIFIPSTFEAASAGASMLAAIACGQNPESLNTVKSFKPSDKKDYYNKKYTLYKDLENKLWKSGDIS